MNKLKLYLIASLVVLFACRKEEVEKPDPDGENVPTVTYRDSVSFDLGGKSYVFNDMNMVGTGNRQVNLKPFTSEIPGRSCEEKTGGYYFYGSPDSVLYEAFYGYSKRLEYGDIKVIFTKLYRIDQLRKDIFLRVPADNSALFQVGRRPFAVDYDKENTTEGVVLDVGVKGIPSLTTAIPGFSILVRSSLKKDLQDNSVFEIKKCEKLDDRRYLVEAAFEVNLYDREGNLYRAKNGFMRLITSMQVNAIVNTDN